MNALLGIPIVQTEHAVTAKIEFNVVMCGRPTKRRKRYMVRKTVRVTPGAYCADGTWFMHPWVYRRMLEHTKGIKL